MQKHQCTAHLVHTEETQMVKINPEYPTLVGLIILTWFWHIKRPELFFDSDQKGDQSIFRTPVANMFYLLGKNLLLLPLSHGLCVAINQKPD